MNYSQKYTLILTKSEVNKLYDLVRDYRDRVPLHVRRQLSDMYIEANQIIVNGGGA